MQTQSMQSIAHRLRQTQQHQPRRFILFLGAGASDSSGIPIASWMIGDFERQLKALWELEHHPCDEDFSRWLEARPGWTGNTSLYAKYFEAYEPTERGRTLYINKWMETASPGWGYFCLAQLLARSYFDTIITTNFDDLIYEACTLYSVRRPRVYSASTPYTSLEHDHDRPTIIKLHGDYLYGKLRNTTKELQELDRRLMTEVSTLFARHEIIVIGYSGTDERIMTDLFANMPSSNGVYWCTYKQEPIPESVLRTISPNDTSDKAGGEDHHQHWFQVKTDGFDRFMDELVNQLEFSLPGITQPIQALIDAIPGRIEGSNSRYTLKYFDEAIQQLKREEKELARAHGVETIPRTPYRLRLEAMYARLKRQYDDAYELYGLLTKLPNQDTPEVLIEYAVTLELMGKYPDALDLRSRIEKEISRPDDLGNYGWLLANLGEYGDGVKYMKQAIDKAPGLREWQDALAMILSEDAQVIAASDYAKDLTEMFQYDGRMWAARSMVHSLMGDYKPEALEYAQTAIRLNEFGFVENLSFAFALAGIQNYSEAISALNAIEGEDDDVRYRALGHIQMLAGDTAAAIDNLQKAVDFTRPAIRPKAMALLGVAFLINGNSQEARETFEEASVSRHTGRHYKMDDELAFALCHLGTGKGELGLSIITRLCNESGFMRGLLAEFDNLLRIMERHGIGGCDECLKVIAKAGSN